ncbi:MAG: tandem-95 repeat protein, partial [Opitutae bacterium]|nr:tandem-95 repeat protein [Opitutae bacterium]
MKTVSVLFVALSFSVVSAIAQIAQVRHAPSINGTVEGSVQQMTGESVTLNGGAKVTQDLLVPGVPSIRLNGKPNYGGTLDGAGVATPTNYQITLNGSATLGHVVRRTNAAALPTVAAVPGPTGTASVTVNGVGQSIDWATLRNLTLNGGVGQYAVPAGTYGDFIANGGGGFTLGVAGATTPAVYNFQHLTLNGNARFDVVGPVVVNLANGFSANGTLGAAGQPAWLTMNVASGGLTLNGGVNFHGYVLAPSGTVIVNGNSVLVGGVISDRLIVNGGGVLRLQAAQAPNQPPTVAIAAPAAGATFDAPASFTIVATASDSDGTVARVEFFQDTTKIGEDTSAPFSVGVANLGTGSYTYTARATDNSGASVTSTPVAITVSTPNVPPTVALTSPAEGATFHAPATITLAAAATDSDGTIAKVEFFQDDAKIGESATAPFALATAPLPVGTYAFRAIATDNQGATAASTTVNVTVIAPNAAPTVAIDSPTDGSTFDVPAAFTVQASASDADGTIAKVEFFRDAVKIGEALAAPYALAVSGLEVGTYNFLARATDDRGSATDSAGVRITVAVINDAPTATPQDAATLEDTPLALTLSGADPENDALTFVVTADPQHGTLSGTPPALVYTPHADFAGADSFSFTASDGALTSAPATISITVTPVNDPPRATPLALTLAEDTVAPVPLAGSDVEGAPLAFLVLSQPTHGVLSGTAPDLNYTPAANYHGPDSFTYAVSDGELTSASATVALDVTPVNDAPSADAASLTVHAGATLNLTLTASDVDGDALAFNVTQPPQHGALSGTPPNLVYTPVAGYSGADSIAFTASDSLATSPAALISLTIANTAPEAQPQSVAASEDTPKPISLTAQDADGDALSYEIAVPPAHGTLSGTAPNLTYTPAADYHGPDEFAFRVTDGVAYSAPAIVSVDVEPINDPPVALSFSRAVSEGGSVDVTLAASDADGDPLTFTVLTPPTHGTLGGTPPALTYRPENNFGGTDTFTYRANDGQADSAVATVALDITDLNQAPVADAQSVETIEDAPKAITLAGSDADNDALTFAVIEPPAHGALSGTPPSLVYTPQQNFSGNDSFRFAASDGSLISAPATVSLHIAPVNDAPVAAPQEIPAIEDTPVEFDLLAGDVDGDALTYAIVTPPAHGTLSGALTGPAPHLVYTPEANYHGTDTLVFKVSDGQLESAPAEMKFTVQAVNDAPTGADFTVPAVEDTPATFALIGNDADGDAVTFQIVTPPAHGTLTPSGASYVYVPAANFFGTDSFTYLASDGTAQSGTITVTIEVAPVNDAPTAAPDSIATAEDTPATVALAGTDVENSPLTFRVVTPPTHGTLAPAGTGYAYTPAPDYFGSDSFSFVANDGELDSAPAVVAIDVTPVNDAPIAHAPAQPLTTPEDNALPVTLTGSDVDGDTLAFTVTTLPQHGVLSGSGRDLVYTPAPDYHGPDSFAFAVSDGAIASAPATVSIDVTPVNDAPVATDNSIATDEDVAVTLTLGASDVDGDLLTFAITTAPAHGTLSGTPPNLTYTSAPNYHGADSLTFIAHDGTIASAPAMVAFTISSVNDAPVAVPVSATTAEDTAVALALTGSDVDGDPLTFVVTSQPAHGVLSGAAPNLIYAPAANYHGVDNFRFVASDGSATSPETTAEVTITPVNDAPVATPAVYETTTGQPLSLVLAGTDVDGDALAFTALTPPTRGTLTGTPPNLVYTSAPDFGGFDSFTFRANDGSLDSAPATVQLTSGLPPRSRTFTTTADFAEGTLFSVSTATPDELTNKVVLTSFDAVWVANSQKGTVVKIDPDTGRVVGEFFTKPSVSANTPYPSRVAVDSKGNVWVANYSDNSLVKIGIPENGFWVDRNGNGRLDTSGALGDVLAWDADALAAATDEAILLYLRTNASGVRHLSIDAQDNVWVGGAGGTWQKFNGTTGELMRSEPDIGFGGQGGFISPDGKLYSAGKQFLIWDTATAIETLPISNNVRDGAWASALDSKGNLWVTKDWTSTVVKYAPDGTKLGEFYHGEPWAMGIAIDANDHVWIAHSHCGHSVGHLLDDGTLVGNVEVANHGPVEVSIDRRGRIWVVSSTGVVERINPLGGPLGSDGQTPVGEVDTTTGNLGGALWTYGRFTGSSTGLTSPEGRWTIVHDGQLAGTTWGSVVWDALLCNDGNVVVEAALSADGVTFGAWQTLTYANATPSGTGRFLKLRARLVSATTGEPPVLYSVTVGTAGYTPPAIAPSWSVNAGADIEGNWPDTIQLKAAFCHSAHDFPVAPTYAWSVVSGPAAVQLDDPAALRPKAQFGALGNYVLRLTATLDGVVRTDDITVALAPYNRPPYANAGYTTFRADVPAQLWLWGTVRDDGLPNGAAVTSTWSQVFGPAGVQFTNPAAPSTTAQFPGPGVYVLKLSASDTALTSSDVTTVWLGYSCIPVAPDGLVSWWQASANGDDHVGGNQAFTERGTDYAEGKIGGAFRFDGLNDRVRVFAAPALDTGAGDTAGFSLELWVNPSAARTATIFEYSSGTTRGFSLRQLGNRIEADFREVNNTAHLLGVDGALPANTWTHVAATYDRASGEARVYVNGTLRASQAIGSFALRTNLDVNFGGQTASAESFGGLLDEISVYNRAIYPDEIATIYAHPAGKRPPVANVAPIVSAGPTLYNRTANTAVPLNGTVTDDGQPVDGVLTSKWTKLSGPGVVDFASPTSPQTTATFSEGGIYLLQLEADDGGFCAKATVEVRVDALYKVEPDPATLVAWWPFNKDDLDVVHGLKMERFNGAAIVADDRASRGLSLDGSNDLVRTRAVPELNIGASAAGFTVEFWVKRDSITDSTLFSWRNGAGTDRVRGIFNNAGNEFWAIIPMGANGGDAWVSSNIGQITANVWHHLAVTFDAPTRIGRIYVDGRLSSAETTFGAGTPDTPVSGALFLGATPSDTRFRGTIDEFTLYSRPLSATEINAVYSAGVVGKAPPDDNRPPLVSAGPDVAIPSTATTATLAGTATDDGRPLGGTLSVAWSKVDGPGDVAFAHPTQASTTATFSASGVYLLRLDANDGLNQAVPDFVSVFVGASALEPQPTPPLAAWWPGNGTPTEVVRGNHDFELINGATYASGEVSQGFRFNTAGNFARTPAHADFNIGASAAGFTVEFWVKRDSITDSALFSWRNGAGADRVRGIFNNAGNEFWAIIPMGANGGDAWVSSNIGQITANVWHHLAVTFDASTRIGRIYVDGRLSSAETTFGTGTPDTPASGYLYLGATPSDTRFRGTIDEFTLYSRPLSTTEVNAIYTAGNNGK